jgi:predicted ATPase
MWSKGFGAEETEAAFARASDLSLQTQSGAEQSTVYYARWIRSFVRGEMNSARMIAESFLREAEAEGRRGEAVVARRTIGSTLLFQGELALARSHIERALADIGLERDMDARRLFGTDTRVTATTYLVLATWLLGDVEYARRLVEAAVRDGHASSHVATIVHAYLIRAILEALRDDPTATLDAAELLLTYAKEHDISLYAAWGLILTTWARGRLVDPQRGAAELRQALAAYLEQGNKIFAQHYYGLIAELEAMTDRADSALASVDAGLALAQETGERWTDPLLLRLKGEILLERNSANRASAEEAFRMAIAVAEQQGARSFGLRAALSLAKLNQSTGRPAEARAILAPALKGFSPTSEMPEIAAALALMERLA